MVQPVQKTVWWFLTQQHTLIVQSSKCAPCVYPKVDIHTKTCTWVFVAAVLIIAKTRMQPRCPSVGERIRRLWCIQAVECYSVPKRDELSNYEETWENLKCMSLSERSPSEKATHCMIPPRGHSGKGKTVARVKRSLVAKGWGWGGEAGGMNKQSTEEI